MVKSIQIRFNTLFSKGHERTVRAKKNIALSVLLKGGSVAITLFLVPLTIQYVNPTQYGIWLTLSSIIAWFSFFDIGLGNGLKNKLTEAIALNKLSDARTYVSTTYAVLIIISIVIFILFSIGNPYINWEKILNIQSNTGINLTHLVFILFAFFCLQFVVQIINTVLTANHETSKSSLINLISQLVIIIIIYILTKSTQGSLSSLIFVLAGVPVLIFIAASFWLYNTSYKKYAPSIKHVEFKYAKDLLSVGGVFFVIQIGALILFQTDNIVITQIFGPEEVTTFNIAYKLFSTVTMVFTIIITPFWSGFTEAYTKKDFNWIRNIVSKMKKLWLILSLFTIALLICSPFLYRLWVGEKIKIPFNLSIAMALSVIASIWQTIHVFLLNGINKIRLQLYLVIISSIINIPMAIFFGKIIGVAGVTLSNAILFAIMGFIFSIQTKKILNNTATGIFNA